MILLGLLLMAIAVAAVTGVAVSSSTTAPVHVFGHTAHAHQVGVIFVAGAIAGMVFAIGASMVLAALGRRRARRREARVADRARLAEQRALRDRNAELERTLATERPVAAGPPPAGEPQVTSSPANRDLTEAGAADRPSYAERGPAH
ncbi:MAG: hypothetical protein ACJ735_14015 [Actinomycetes bacterium]